MKKVLIMGITGGFCGYVADALSQDGWSIYTLMCNPNKLPDQLKAVTVI